MGYQKYQVPYQIAQMPYLPRPFKVLYSSSVAWPFRQLRSSQVLFKYVCPYGPELRTIHIDQSEESWAGSPDALPAQTF